MLEFVVFLDKKVVQKAVISKERITIGRSLESDLVLRNEHVSRLHLIIEQEGENFRLYDRSANGVLLNSQRVSESILLPPRCRIEIYPFAIDCLHQRDDPTTLILDKKAPFSSDRQPVITDDPLRETLSSHFGTLIGESSSMRQIYQLIEDVSHTPVTVLIRGEHGTGKELVACAIHESSTRKGKPFIAINCAAIPLDLIESELFGYEKGAFTGAQTARKGKIEEAEGGTLFLDEIGELSPAAQAKFLRVLQSRTLMRLGSAHAVPVNIRVISATNKDLERAVQAGTFRADLYYRIKVVQILLPPLRERPEDIPLLCTHILKKLASELGLSSEPTLTPEAMNRLKTSRWPGNIRQLENVLYSAVIRSRSPYILTEPILLADSPTWIGLQQVEPGASFDTLTKQHLLEILKQADGDTAKAAEVLKVSRGTIYYKLKKYGIDVREISRHGLR